MWFDRGRVTAAPAAGRVTRRSVPARRQAGFHCRSLGSTEKDPDTQPATEKYGLSHATHAALRSPVPSTRRDHSARGVADRSAQDLATRMATGSSDLHVATSGVICTKYENTGGHT